MHYYIQKKGTKTSESEIKDVNNKGNVNKQHFANVGKNVATKMPSSYKNYFDYMSANLHLHPFILNQFCLRKLN